MQPMDGRFESGQLTLGKQKLAVTSLSFQGGKLAMDAREHGTAPERTLDLAVQRFNRTGRPAYAIIDIGSNSVRLVVYDEIGRAPFPRFNEKALCQLGDGFARTGTLTPDGIARTLAALRRFHAIADAMGVERIDTLATEAVRQANNGPELVAQIARQTGLAARVLSGDEEAYFGALGVVSGFYRPDGITGDMGGGSLEMADVTDDHVGTNRISLPLGALPVRRLLEAGVDAAKTRTDALLRQGVPPGLTSPTFFAVGGGWRAFARAHLAATRAPVQVVHGYTVSADDARGFAKSVLRLSPAKIAALPGLPKRRVGSLPAAALVLDRVVKRLRPERVVFSMLGVREGWLYSQLSPAEQDLDPLVEAAQSFGLPYARVPAFAAALTQWTAGLFAGEIAAERRLRVAACALSDFAWRDEAGLRATESFRRLLLFPLIGLDHAERVFLAVTIHARYGGATNDPTLSQAISLLPPPLVRRAQLLGRALLLGYRLAGGVPEILAAADLRIGDKTVRLTVKPTARVPESEVVADRLKMLADAAGIRRTEIVVAGDGRGPNGSA
jgi:exopolyphosphatase/guanosine-5'-triphosphate,3'-diphosphate pyrophosphatase